jgi:hypothetical protein
MTNGGPMEFFTEKNGVHRAASFSKASSPVNKAIVFILLPLLVIATVHLLTPGENAGGPSRMLLLTGAGMAVFNGIVILLLKSSGMYSMVSVDLMNGLLTFRNPGNRRLSVPLGTLNGIVVHNLNDSFGILCLMKTAGGRHIVMHSKDISRLRSFAGELSSLTSLTVFEEAETQKQGKDAKPS